MTAKRFQKPVVKIHVRVAPNVHPSRDWQPIRRGAVYCSPACGGGCQHSDYLRALRRGRAAAKSLRQSFGCGWMVEVWENLGWHVAVKKGRLEVHLSNGGCWANFLTRGGQYHTDAKTPRAGVKKVLQLACTAAHNILDDATEVHA